VFSPDDQLIGTLCFLDARAEAPILERDIQFLSLLAMRVSAELERERLIEARVAAERATAAHLGEMNDRLLRAAEENRRLTTIVVHDLRQPLATLATLLSLARDAESPEERTECLALLDARLEALSTLVDELLDFSHLGAAPIIPHAERIDLRQMLEECVESFIPEAQVRNVRLVLEVSSEPGEGYVDRAKLFHVLGNLIFNGIKFCHRSPAALPGGGTVVVRTRSCGPSKWGVEVLDDGMGMDTPVLEQIFGEFYQAPGVRDLEAHYGFPPGRGLGLSIVRHLCNLLEIQVSVSSQVGVGTCFSLVIPRGGPEP